MSFRNNAENKEFWFVCLVVFNATFNKISITSWRPVLLVGETGGPGPGENTDLSQVTDELYHIMLYTSSWSRFELTSVVIGTDCTDSCKSKKHTTTTAPFKILKYIFYHVSIMFSRSPFDLISSHLLDNSSYH